MTFNMSEWSIRRPLPPIVLFALLLVLGITSFLNLPISRLPNIDIPLVQVAVSQSGAAPAELELQVTRPVEDALAGINGVKHINSTINHGLSQTLVEFQLGTDQGRALNDVRDAVSRIRLDLPRTIDEPIIERIDIEGLPIATYAVSAPAMTPEDLSWFVDDTVIRDLQNIDKVAKIIRIGGIDREITVGLAPERLAAYAVTAAEVSRQLRATAVDLAGGKGDLGGREQAIRVLAGRHSAAEIARTAVALPNGLKVGLDRLATVRDGTAEPVTFALLDGKPVVAFAVSRAKGASDTVIAAELDRRVAELSARHPGVSISKIDSTVDYTLATYYSTMSTLVEGAVLAVIVVAFFLRDFRATLTAAVALPLSIIPTFWFMSAAGFSLNVVSLLAITIVTGILVDDAIVEIENVVRHVRMGKSAHRAALDATREIGLAVIAISITNVAVFVPVSFMGGIAGQYFKQFGLVVAVSVLFSLLVARLITPILAAYFMRAKPISHGESALLSRYTRLVSWSVQHRGKTIGLALLIFAASILSLNLLPRGFVPAEDTGRVMLGFELSPGSRLDDTRTATELVSRRMAQFGEVKSVLTIGGLVLGSGTEPRKATLIVNLADKAQRKTSPADFKRALSQELRKIPDIRFWFFEDDGQRQLQVAVLGRDAAAVEKAAADIARQARELPQLDNVISTADLPRPELIVRPRMLAAAELGVSTEAIADTIRVATIGDLNANLARVETGGRQVPIRVMLRSGARGERRVLQDLRVRSAAGNAIPLTAVAALELAQGASQIDRYDRLRRVTIGADLVSDAQLGDAVDAIRGLSAARELPDGVDIRELGSAEIMQDVFKSFGRAILAGVVMVYAVLVLLFSRTLQPLTILVSLPLSVGGATLALVFAGKALSLPVVIGILMLIGIVTKNAIMLVDFAIEQMATGMERTQALVEAGRKRARPVIMTTVAMAGGMLPSALGLGEAGEFRAPMAIAVIGGLLSSTALSLLFVPAFFALLDDLGISLSRRFRGYEPVPETTPAA